MTPDPSSLRILMLGWEYPPRVAGGLGKASQGLARGLSACGADVLFVLPHYPRRQDGPSLCVTGADSGVGTTETGRDPLVLPGLNALTVPAHLFPYQRPRPLLPEAEIDADGQSLHDDLVAPLYGHDLGRQVAEFAERVAVITRRVPVDVVHANDWMSFPAAFAAAATRRLPVFLHVHSTEYDRSGEHVNAAIAYIEREACARATHVFAVSHYTADVLRQRYAVPADKITVVYNAPDAPRHAPASRQRAPWIVFLGRLTFQKGPDHFLRAAALTARHAADARFLVCGSGDMDADLRALAQTLGIADRVAFLGFLTPAQVDAVLVHARMLVMSSVSEPFGLVALEALRDGTPVILSKQSGVREVLGHSLQVDFWDHEKLADQMLALLRLPVLGRQLVESGSEQAAQLSWQASAHTVIQAYARVCGLPRPGALE